MTGLTVGIEAPQQADVLSFLRQSTPTRQHFTRSKAVSHLAPRP